MSLSQSQTGGSATRAIRLIQLSLFISSLTMLLPLSHYRVVGESLGAGDLGNIFVLRALVAAGAALPVAAFCVASRRLTGMFVTGVMWTAITATSALLVPDFGWFTIAWGMLGVSDAVLAVSVPLLLAHLGQRRSVAASGTWLLQAVGAGVGLLAGLFIEPVWNVTWRGVGLVLVAGTGPLALAAATVTAVASSNRTKTALSLGEVLARITVAESNRRAITRAGSAAFVLTISAHTMIPLLADRWQMSLPEASAALGFASLGGGIVSVRASAWWNSRFGRRTSLAFVAAAFIPCLLTPPADPSPLRFLMALLVALPIVAAVGALCASAAATFAPTEEETGAAAVGLTALAVASGTLIAVVLFGTLDRRFGTAVALVVLTVIGLIALGATETSLVEAPVVEAPVVEASGADPVAQPTSDRFASSGGSASNERPILEVANIDLYYGSVQVLFDVSLAIQPGEIVALLGTNGAGKSSLLKVISGQVVPQNGVVLLSGTDITSLGAERRVPLGLIQIPGGKAVFGPLSVSENLELFASSLGGNKRQIQRGMDKTFSLFPRLAERKDQAAETLSGGEQQMLALGKALLLQPHILCIDELSLGLAPTVVADLLAVLRSIHQEGTTIVLVEQSLNVAFSIAQRAVFMEKGEIRFDGLASDLRDRSDLLRSVFFAESPAT